ncbi:MAG: ATP-binding protein [Gammaproteobacteria bacterium]|nr:ATP-binding protein [Gammaproteobacteria bacterium]
MSNPLQLQKIYVNGFKSLDNFYAEFQPHVTVLVGANGAGKSSVLQFISFLQAFLSGMPLRFFEQRAWQPENIKPFFCHTSQIKAKLIFSTDNETQIIWTFQWDITDNLLCGESLKYQKNKHTAEVFAYPIKPQSNTNRIQVGNKIIDGLRLSGSVLAVLDSNIINDNESRMIAQAVLEWGRGIFALELMNPTVMRRGITGNSWHFGHQGEWLSSFLAELSSAQKERIAARLSQFHPSLKNVHTVQKTGWVDLQIAEYFPNADKIHADHISDGSLRLIAIASLPELSHKISLILLDEIEDGIDPHILPDLIDSISQEQNTQWIMTSHSPVLVNRFEPVAVRFLTRTDTGATISVGFNEIKEIQKDFEYQGAGEIWLHTSSDSMERWVKNFINLSKGNRKT